MPRAKSTMKSRKRKPETPKFDAEKLLLAIVRQAAFDGWTPTALQSGAVAAGVEEGRSELTYPRGVRDVVAAFSGWANDRMLERIAADRSFTARRVRDKVAFAVRVRLEALAPHRESVRQLMTWGTMPHHAPDAMLLIYRVCDVIWRKAGDTSTDFNFYTKRGLLAYVLKTTTFFWLSDASKGQAATWEFLERRIAEALKAGQVAGKLKDFPSQLAKLSALADVARFFKRAA
ncbi:MAG: COQ9 family protein [Alphaproteobacteria bacterium]